MTRGAGRAGVEPTRALLSKHSRRAGQLHRRRASRRTSAARHRRATPSRRAHNVMIGQSELGLATEIVVRVPKRSSGASPSGGVVQRR